MDETHPHALLRVRVHGHMLAAQPYSADQRYGRPLLIDLQKGTIALGEKMLDLQKDYLVVHAILGVQRLRTCVAVPVVTTANAMATVGGHTIYKVKGTQVLTAHGRVPDDKLDARLLVHLKDAVDPIGCGAGLHFCATSNLTCSMQRGAAADTRAPLWQRSDSEMWFNAVMSEPLCHAGAHQYVTPCILGFVRQLQQLRMKAGVREVEITVTLVARRSRYRVGTRHWRRGVDNQGYVANFVETEQIVEAATGEVSSFVQVRGSIPVPWSHVPNTRYKPPTAIGDAERHCRAPFNAHARHLAQRYSAITAINLVNQSGSEGRLSAAFDALVQGLPANMPFQLVTFDFHRECGKASYENLRKLWDQVARTFEQHGSCRARADGVGRGSTQAGVMRTNCVDCLDRTNVVQALFARRALEGALRELLLLDRGQRVEAAFPELERRFRILWADHGDMLSVQYAGTGALKAGFTRTGKRTADGYVDDGLKSAVRYFLNNYEDGHKQDSYDLMTGTFRPREVKSEGDVAPPSPSAAFWVLGSLFIAIIGLSLTISAPLSRRVHFVSHALPTLALGCALFGAVMALGVKATCRPALRPDLVQPWLPPPGKAPPQAVVKKTA